MIDFEWEVSQALNLDKSVVEIEGILDRADIECSFNAARLYEKYSRALYYLGEVYRIRGLILSGRDRRVEAAKYFGMAIERYPKTYSEEIMECISLKKTQETLILRHLYMAIEDSQQESI